MNPQLEQLNAYVDHCRQNGMNEANIRESLLKANRSTEIINQALPSIDKDGQAATKNSNSSIITHHSEKPRLGRPLKIAAIVLLVMCLMVGIGTITINKSESVNQGLGSYKRPPTPQGWFQSKLLFDDKIFSFAHPSDWNVEEQYNEPSGTYSDVRIKTSDWEGVSSIDDMAKQGIVARGAMFDISVQKYQGSLESYERGIKNKTIGTAGMWIDGYQGLEQTSFGGRPTLTYLQNTNYVREVVIVDGSYAVKFSYFQPYKIPDPKVLPKLEDSHIAQFTIMVSSFGIE